METTAEPSLACVTCGKLFRYQKALDKHVRTCGVSEVAAVAEATPPAAAPATAAFTDTRKQQLCEAMDAMFARMPEALAPRRGTVDSPLVSLEAEFRAMQREVSLAFNTVLAHRALVGFASVAERATQIPVIRSRVDLQGYAQAVADDAQVHAALKDVMAQYPGLELSPEARLGLALVGAATETARRNAEKKDEQESCKPSAAGCGNSVSS
jgi:hypothetical protein